jgi:hypothetical protein
MLAVMTQNSGGSGLADTACSLAAAQPAPTLLTTQGRFNLANTNEDDATVVPIPGEDNEPERQRIRKSNDRDQELERQGKQSRHNRGYDEAADGVVPAPEIERIVDE